ncbi:hypothetical protein ABTF07_21065, partial [Acinetobacter baumannii]
GFNLKLLLEEVVTLNSNWASYRKIDLVLRYPDDLPVWVSGYIVTLRNTINALLNIAIAQSRKERVSITMVLIKKELK